MLVTVQKSKHVILTLAKGVPHEPVLHGDYYMLLYLIGNMANN